MLIRPDAESDGPANDETSFVKTIVADSKIDSVVRLNLPQHELGFITSSIDPRENSQNLVNRF